MGDLTNNLSRWEIACKCGCGFDTLDIKTAEAIQKVCDNFKCKVTITSGCRCEEYNAEVGGAKDSQHPKARAADCVFHDINPASAYHFLDIEYPDELGLGLYEDFVHIDSRSGKARWRD